MYTILDPCCKRNKASNEIRNGSQSLFSESAVSPWSGNSLVKQALRLHLRLFKSDTLELGPSNLMYTQAWKLFM